MNVRELLALAPVRRALARGRGALALVPPDRLDRRARARAGAARRPLPRRLLRRDRRPGRRARDRYARVQPGLDPRRRGRVPRVALSAGAEARSISVARSGSSSRRERELGLDATRRRREPVRARPRRARRARSRALRQPPAPAAVRARRVRRGVAVRDARAPPARGRAARVARGAADDHEVRHRDDPVVRPEPERPRRVVRREGASPTVSTTTARSATATTVRSPTTTSTATPTARPIQGHLTIASFAWWTRQFEAAGFERDAATERRIHPHLARSG